LHLLQKLHTERKETEVRLRKGTSQPTLSSSIEEMLEDVKHPRGQEGMNKRTGAAPPRTAGTPNTRGYQEDQPRDAASAACCASLRPASLPSQSRQASSRQRKTGVANRHSGRR
jgi:hypothetical protein